MEGKIQRNIDIHLCTTSSRETPVSILSVSWPQDSSQLLLAVTRRGHMDRVALVNRTSLSSVTLTGFSRQKKYIVDVYGLVEVTGKKLSDVETRIYSIEASRRVYVSPNQLSGKIWIELNHSFHRDSILTSLKSENPFKIQVNPMDYRLDSRLPAGCTIVLYFLCDEQKREEYVLVSRSPCRPSLIPPCIHRGVYTVQGVAVQQNAVDEGVHSYKPTATSYPYVIKIYSSKPQLLEMLRRAKKFCLEYSNCPDTYPIKHFYRDKPGTYFQHIMEQNDGLMEKSLKDAQGDQFSPINNRIKGLMFSSSLDNRHFTPPFCSETGDQRLFIPVHSVFDAETNMFFADFYCRCDVHYVTLVLAKNGSTEDRFCKRKLVQLDKRLNPFFTVEKPKAYHHYTMKLQKTFRVVSVHKFKVEFFYTESINILEWLKVYEPKEMYFKTVEGYVKRRSREMLKNPSCLICNLPPCL